MLLDFIDDGRGTVTICPSDKVYAISLLSRNATSGLMATAGYNGGRVSLETPWLGRLSVKRWRNVRNGGWTAFSSPAPRDVDFVVQGLDKAKSSLSWKMI